MDLFKMANQIASNMSVEDKDAIENMDMEKMISHVTKNIFKMMKDPGQNDNPLSALGDLIKNKPDVSDVIYQEEDMSLPKTRDITFDLNINLEEFYTGKKKKLVVKRKRIANVDGIQKITEEKKKLVIPIERGMKDEQQIRFEGEADQYPGYRAGDIVITLIENEHPVFQRDKNNLIFIKNINFYEVFDLTFEIKHLDNRIIRIHKDPNDSLYLNDSLRKISGEGMPIFEKKNGNNKFGDLFIRFNLIIPRMISDKHLPMLKEIFDKDPETGLKIKQREFKKSDNEYILENINDDKFNYSSESESDSSLESDCESVDSDSLLESNSESVESDSTPPPPKVSPRLFKKQLLLNK